MKVFSKLLLMILLTYSSQSYAVSCVVSVGERAHIAQSFQSSDNIFSAFVEEIFSGYAFGNESFQLARLRVLQVWKGPLKPGDIVTATAEDSISFVSDGYIPALHSGILVYSRGEQPFVLGSCTRTTRLDYGTRDIPELNKLSGNPRFKLGR